MAQKSQIYKCKICGNIVEVLDTGGGTLICCGQNMELQQEKTQDEGNEKHVPIIERNEEGVIVKIGSEPHPMEPEHYIEWVEISTDKGESKKFLKPDSKPEALFPVKVENIKARIYCNIHGLWKSL